MQIKLNNYNIECFELEKDYKDYIQIEGKNLVNVYYHGTLYGIPQNVRQLFNTDVILFIRKNVYNNTEFVIIHN